MDSGGGTHPQGNACADHTALTSGAGLLDRSDVGRLSFTGDDTLDLLNRLSTNDLLALRLRQATHTVLTSPKGRIIDILYVLRSAHGVLVHTAPETRQKVMEWIEFYTFGEDVNVRDVTDDEAMLSVTGLRVVDVLEGVLGGGAASLAPDECKSVRMFDVDVTILRSDFLGRLGYDLIVPLDAKTIVWNGLLETDPTGYLRPVGEKAFEAVRVERGLPTYGQELSEDYNPLEAGLLHYVSFTKGCYVGQEVITRLNTYKKVQKRLVGLLLNGLAPLGAKLLLDGEQVGLVTSIAMSPEGSRYIGLAYVKKSLSVEGALLRVEWEEGYVTTRVHELPSSAI